VGVTIKGSNNDVIVGSKQIVQVGSYIGKLGIEGMVLQKVRTLIVGAHLGKNVLEPGEHTGNVTLVQEEPIDEKLI
jgi:hypothetical protein